MKKHLTSGLLAIAISLSLPATAAHAQAQKSAEEIVEALTGKKPPCPKGLRCRTGELTAAVTESGPQKVDLNIQFANNSAEILPAAAGQLAELLRALKGDAVTGLRLEIAGHTSATGSAAHNRDLSLRRAKAVQDYLEAHNLPTDRFSIAGYGFDRLLNSDNPKADENRRVEIRRLD
jgi:outer membrane protein OmpA-like peptidoglycan-associated protein